MSLLFHLRISSYFSIAISVVDIIQSDKNLFNSNKRNCQAINKLNEIDLELISHIIFQESEGRLFKVVWWGDLNVFLGVYVQLNVLTISREHSSKTIQQNLSHNSSLKTRIAVEGQIPNALKNS